MKRLEPIPFEVSRGGRASAVASLAANSRRKPNRQDAWEVVLALLDRSPGVSDKELATLYAWFLPKPAKRPRSEVEWVALSVGTGNVAKANPWTVYLYSDGEWLSATDRHRAHRAWLEWPAGVYDVAGTPVEVRDADLKRMNENARLICDDALHGDWVGTLDPDNLPVEHVAEVSRAMVRPDWAERTVGWELDYVRDALAMATSPADCFRPEPRPGWRPVGLAIGESMQAVVMPRRIEPTNGEGGDGETP